MKRLLMILIPLVVIGGITGAAVMLGIFSSGKSDKKNHKTDVSSPSTALPSLSAGSDDAHNNPNDPAVDNPSPSTAALSPRTPADSSRPVTVSDADMEKDLTRLSSVYEQMPPEEAGKIMAKLPDKLVEKLLRRMDERQVGKLLLTFEPDRAAKLTLALADEKSSSTP